MTAMAVVSASRPLAWRCCVIARASASAAYASAANASFAQKDLSTRPHNTALGRVIVASLCHTSSLWRSCSWRAGVCCGISVRCALVAGSDGPEAVSCLGGYWQGVAGAVSAAGLLGIGKQVCAMMSIGTPLASCVDADGFCKVRVEFASLGTLRHGGGTASGSQWCTGVASIGALRISFLAPGGAMLCRGSTTVDSVVKHYAAARVFCCIAGRTCSRQIRALCLTI